MNVSSVKNLNGETFSAVQDATLTDVVQTNSAQWNEISAYEQNSASYITAHQSLEDYATTSQLNTASSFLSGAIDYVSSNASGGGGTTYTGDAQGALDSVYVNSGKWWSADDSSALFYANKAVVGNATYWGPVLSANANAWNDNTNFKFQIRANCLAFGFDDNNSHYSSFYTSNVISSYGTSNGWSVGNWDWHLDYRGLGGKFSDNDSNTATWSALRNVDLGLTNSGTISAISGRKIAGFYVPLSATDCGIGNGCTGANNSLAQGYINSAKYTSLAQGQANTAVNDALAQGTQNSANDMSFAQGKSACAYNHSLAQGYITTAIWNSVAVGVGSLAKGQSIAVGRYNQAESNSQAFGNNVSSTNSGMAIGTYNNITTGAFVVGNGYDGNPSDAFIIYHDGSVSACGKISANGVELGGGVTFDSVNNIVLTSTLPASPDATTLYLIPEA